MKTQPTRMRDFLKKTVAALVLCIIAEGMQAGQVTRIQDSLFQEGIKYYQQNQFGLAAKAFEQVVAMHYESPELYYNLGNAYFKSGNNALAILYYEKARLFAPHDEDIIQNLAIANTRVIDKIDVIPEFFIKRWKIDFVNLFPSDRWAQICVASFFAGLLLLLVYFFSHLSRLKRLSFYTAVFLIVISLISYGSGIARRNQLIRNNAAIIVIPSVTIKSSPDENGNNLFVLHDGTKVWVTDSVQQWKEIRISNGNKGWLESKALLPI